MKTYTFYLVLASTELSDRDCDRLFEAGCDDATIVSRDGTTRLAFDRTAPSLEEAIQSATEGVRSAGFGITGIEMDAPNPLSRTG